MSSPTKRLGLALAGGVARGLAHVGVIQALEDAGVRASFVSGVSAGAIVGACYASGMTADQLAELAHSMRWHRLARPVLLNPFRGGLERLGLLDFYNLELALIDFIGDRTFAQLAHPLAVGVTDMESGQPLTLTTGRVAPAVRASASVPGVVVPVRLGGRLLCDGFASNNLPIAVLRDMGAQVILAVDIMPTHRRLPGSFFWAGSHAICNLVRRSGDSLSRADLVVEPDVAECSYLRLDAGDLMARGRAATVPLIPRLLELLN